MGEGLIIKDCSVGVREVKDVGGVGYNCEKGKEKAVRRNSDNRRKFKLWGC